MCRCGQETSRALGRSSPGVRAIWLVKGWNFAAGQPAVANSAEAAGEASLAAIGERHRTRADGDPGPAGESRKVFGVWLSACHAQRIHLRQTQQVRFLHVRAVLQSEAVAVGLLQPAVVVTTQVTSIRTSQSGRAELRSRASIYLTGLWWPQWAQLKALV